MFEAADGGDETLAVDLLNSLLLEFPVSPQISGHDTRDEDGKPDWHMHLADHPSNATAGFAAIAAMGLAFHLTAHGVDRLGLCEAAPCRNAYLDTSTNRSRRYCSDRCATRANVAAYRARKRLAADRSGRHAAPRTPPSPAARAPTADPSSAAGSGPAPGPARAPPAPSRSPCCPRPRTSCRPAPTIRRRVARRPA